MKWYYSLIGIVFVLTVSASGAYMLLGMLQGWLINAID